MLVEVQKTNKVHRGLRGRLLSQIRQEYVKTSGGRASR